MKTHGGDICNLFLSFQQQNFLCRQPRYFHHRGSIAQLHMMADFLLVECILVHAEVEQGNRVDMVF